MSATAPPVVFFDLGDTLVTSPRRWLPGAPALLAQMKASGARLGIISNTTGLASREAILKLLPADFELSLFEPELVLFSSEVGSAKPHPAIYRDAVARAKRPAGECFHCSENIVETLMAQEVGMRAIRVQSPPNSDLDGLAQAIAEFQALR